jgi:pyrimidine deaminase RibD-like protein
VTVAHDCDLLRAAIELSRKAPASNTAFSVGCIIATREGVTLVTGYSRERGAQWHAEEVAIAKAQEAGIDLSAATLYTSLEPCSVRGSGLTPCCVRILEAEIPRVVFAMREPSVFVEGHGAEVLAARGVEVIEMPGEAELVAEINNHLV